MKRQRSVSVLLVAGLLALASGCATVPQSGSVPHEQRTIEMPTSLVPSKALEIVQAAALRGGWTVAEANGSMVSTDAYTPQKLGAFKVKLRANAVSSGGGSVVYLTGVYGVMLRNNAQPDSPIAGGPFSKLNHTGPILWGELERFAQAVRETLPR